MSSNLNEKDDIVLKKRFIELSEKAYQKGVCLFSDFLGLNEQTVFDTCKKNIPPKTWVAYGGYEGAERVCICFLSDPDIETDFADFPIKCIKIKLAAPKFASKLTHRDYLGSLMGLGIKREKIGDICVFEEHALAFVHESISQLVCSELTQVSHYNVVCTEEEMSDDLYTPTFDEITGTVSSLRLDAIISLAFNKSRSSFSELIDDEKVYINGKLEKRPDKEVKEGDVVSVRGYGRFIFSEIGNKTKKGRIFVILKKYVS